jgi:hypothetical protein
MHLFSKKAEALAKLQAEAQAKIEAKALALLQPQSPAQYNVSLLFDFIKLEEDQSSKYKYIFAKSFFNVKEKPISPEEIALLGEINQTLTPELDFSEVMIPKTQDQYNEAYKRARREILKAVNNNNPKIPDEDRLKEAKQALTSKDSVIDYFQLIDKDTYSTLVMLSNLKIMNDLVGTVENPHSPTNSPTPAIPHSTFQHAGDGIPRIAARAASFNNASSPGNSPSTSLQSPRASCLGGIAKAFSSIFNRSATNRNQSGEVGRT